MWWSDARVADRCDSLQHLNRKFRLMLSMIDEEGGNMTKDRLRFGPLQTLGQFNYLRYHYLIRINELPP